MKKSIICLFFCMFVFFLSAQSGIFGLSFQDKYGVAVKKLTDLGFVEVSKDYDVVTFENSKMPYLRDVIIYYCHEEEMMAGWSANFITDSERKYALEMNKILNELHGEYHETSEMGDEYYWLFDEYRMLVVYMKDSDTMSMLYMDTLYDEYF